MQNDMTPTPFVEGRATADAAQALRDELLYHRATQTYLWALPLINTLGMQRGSEHEPPRVSWRLFGLSQAAAMAA